MTACQSVSLFICLSRTRFWAKSYFLFILFLVFMAPVHVADPFVITEIVCYPVVMTANVSQDVIIRNEYPNEYYLICYFVCTSLLPHLNGTVDTNVSFSALSPHSCNAVFRMQSLKNWINYDNVLLMIAYWPNGCY